MHIIASFFYKVFLTISLLIIGYFLVILPLSETVDSISTGSFYWYFRGSHGYAKIEDGRYIFWFVMVKRSIIPLFLGILGGWGLICLWFTEWLPDRPPKRNPTTVSTPPPSKHNNVTPIKTGNNYGQYWTSDEESKLICEYGQMMKIEDIARTHRRTPRAIRMRLEKIGLLAPSDESDRTMNPNTERKYERK